MLDSNYAVTSVTRSFNHPLIQVRNWTVSTDPSVFT